MADLIDVENALVTLIAATVYPNGTGQPSIVPGGAGVAIYPGWPLPADLDADMAALGAGTGGKLHISVYPRPEEHNVTRFQKDWQQQNAPNPTLTLTAGAAAVDGFAGTFYSLWGTFVPVGGGIYQYPTITVGGTVSTPQNVVAVVNGTPFVYAVQAGDTLTTIATGLATLINAQVPGTTSSGPVITLNAPVAATNLQFGTGDGVTTAFPLVPSGFKIIGTPLIFRTGYALQFNGASAQRVTLPAGVTAALNGTTWAIEGWIRGDDTVTPRAILGPRGLNHGREISAAAWAGAGKISFAEEMIAVVANTSIAFAAGEVFHMIYTYDGASIRTYKNGARVNGPTTYAFTGNCAGPYSFSDVEGTGHSWLGLLDGMRIYSRALSATEVAEHFNGIFRDETGLVGKWEFDEGAGTVALDSSGNNNGGTLVGSPAYVASIDHDSLRTSPIDYSLSKTGLVTWTQPPAAGALLNWTGSYSPANATINALRVGASGTSIMEVKRQVRTFQITIWANSEANRSALAGPIDAALGNTLRFTLPDQGSARLIYKGSPVLDAIQKANIYRRDLLYSVEYGTTITETDTQITQEQLNVSPQIDGATAISATKTIYQ